MTESPPSKFEGILENRPLTFEVSLVPARAAYLIKKGSRDGFRRAVQEASTRWGGMTEPIIEVTGRGQVDDWSLDLLRAMEIDSLVDVNIGQRIASRLALKIGKPQTKIELIDSPSSHASWSTNPVSLTRDLSKSISIPEIGAPLWQLALAGDLTAVAEDQLRTQGVSIVREQYPDQVVSRAISKSTLIDLSVIDFAENWSQNQPGQHPAVISVTENDNLADSLEFWNLRAASTRGYSAYPTLILPLDDVKNWPLFKTNFSSLLDRADEFSPDVVLNSLSIENERDLHEFAEQLDLELSMEPFSSGFKWPATRRPRPYKYLLNLDLRNIETFERRYGQIKHVDTFLSAGKISLRFQSPVTFTGPGLTKLLMKHELVGRLPKKECIANAMINNALWENGGIYIRTNSQMDYLVNMNLPSLQESIELILNSFSLNHSLSDKGKTGIVLLEHSEVFTLAMDNVYETISSLNTPRSKELTKELEKAKTRGLAKVELLELAQRWGGRSERKMLAFEQLPPPSGAIPAELLCRANWAERGFRINCKRCTRTSFVPVSQVTGVPTCPSCKASGNFDENNKGIILFYRLNSLLDHAYDQGVIPHVIGISKLLELDRNAHFWPGVDVTFHDSSKTEFDLVGIYKGKFTVGEVKTNPKEFNQRIFLEYLENAIRIQADALILASMHPFDTKFMEFARQRTLDKGLNLIVIQRNKKGVSIDEHTVNWRAILKKATK